MAKAKVTKEGLSQPTDPKAVMFRLDWEPSTPESLIQGMADYQREHGYESDLSSRGGTVGLLEQRMAEILGKEAAMFCPTGTLANHLAVRRHCGTKGRAFVQERSHMYLDEGDGIQRLSSINLVPLATDRVYFTAEELAAAHKKYADSRVLNEVGCVVVESPVRRQGGQIVPFEEMKAITAFCRKEGIGSHLDGARLFMMSAATGIPVRKYTAMFDSVYVSLYKYFGAPFGGILAGSSAFIEGLYHDRRRFGGGIPFAYLIAGLALQGTEGFEERFAEAMDKASKLFEDLNQLESIAIHPFEHGSNIFPMRVAEGVEVERLAQRLRKKEVYIYPKEEAFEGATLLHVNTTVLRQTNKELVQAFEQALT